VNAVQERLDLRSGAGSAMHSQVRLIALCSCVLFIPLLFPLLTGRVFTRDDFAALQLPFRFLYREALRSGDSFLWTSAYHSGFYLLGVGIAGMAHPLHWLLYRFLPLGPAFNLEIITPFAAMLAGTGLLLRRFGLGREAAWFGAMVFTFSGFNLFNLMHMNHAAVIAHLPWLLLATHILLTSPDRRNRALAFAGVALVVGSEHLIGNPQYVWLTYVVLAYMVGCLCYSGAPWSRVALLVGAGALGSLIGAAQLLPTLDFARESTRMAYSRDEALSFSLSPLNLVQLWSPFAFRFRIHAPESEALIVHEFIVYNGAFCTIALAWVAMRWRQQTRRGLLVALLALAAISFVLAMGRYGGVYTWLAQLPGLRNLRAPTRHLVLFQLALSGIAAVAFEDLLGMIRRGEQSTMRRLWPLAVPVAMSLATTVLGAMLAQSSWAAARGLSLSSVTRAAPWSALIVAMAALTVMAARGARWAVPVLIVFVACDQGFWGYSYALRWGPIERIDELMAKADVPAEAQRGELIAPAILGGSSNVAVLRGLRLASGYTGLVASSVLDPDDPTTQRIAGVAWREAGYTWTRTSNPMPRARLVSTARATADISAEARRVDLTRVALVDRPVAGLSDSTSDRVGHGSVRVLEERPGAFVLETTSDVPQLLVLTERFHGGWRATHDRAARETVRVYGDFLGCLVDAGQHRVVLTFAPASAAYGLGASLAGLALTVVATTVFWSAGARRSPTDLKPQSDHIL
jgi:hypothetical protein